MALKKCIWTDQGAKVKGHMFRFWMAQPPTPEIHILTYIINLVLNYLTQIFLKIQFGKMLKSVYRQIFMFFLRQDQT